jgi:DNA invertase Pin-like site-specific DNA recombinase
MNEKFISYIRVSGNSQIEGDGPDRQREAIKRWVFAQWVAPALSHGFEDLGVSGTIDSFDRPGLLQAITTAVQFNAAIVVERADRIARDLIVSELFFRECRTRGIKVYAADTGQELVFTDEDPSRKLIRQILGALSEWEKSVIVKKLKAGRDKKRRETGRCEGRKPYSNLEAIAFMECLRRHGRTLRNIVCELNLSSFRPPEGTLWTRRTVKRIIEREQQKANQL